MPEPTAATNDLSSLSNIPGTSHKPTLLCGCLCWLQRPQQSFLCESVTSHLQGSEWKIYVSIGAEKFEVSSPTPTSKMDLREILFKIIRQKPETNINFKNHLSPLYPPPSMPAVDQFTVPTAWLAG